MKNTVKIFLIALIATTSNISYSQSNGVKKVLYECNFDCPSCKDKVMKNIAYEKGVKGVDVDYEQKLVTVEFKEGKNTTKGIQRALEKLGYTATFKGTATTFGVSGNCGMCKNKIETAAKAIDGVNLATWDINIKKLTVSFNETKTNLDAIQKAIAAIGYDNDKYKASDDAYNQLHSCCKYDR